MVGRSVGRCPHGVKRVLPDTAQNAAPRIGSLRNERSLNSYNWRKIDRRLVQYNQMRVSFEAGMVEVALMAGYSCALMHACAHGYSEMSMDPEAAVFCHLYADFPHTVLR
jgi:hypothetical protein